MSMVLRQKLNSLISVAFTIKHHMYVISTAMSQGSAFVTHRHFHPSLKFAGRAKG